MEIDEEVGNSIKATLKHSTRRWHPLIGPNVVVILRVQSSSKILRPDAATSI